MSSRSSRQSRRKKGKTRRHRRPQPSKQTSSANPTSGLTSAKASVVRAGEKYSFRSNNINAAAVGHEDNREAMVPGTMLGDLGHVRKDLLRIVSLAAITVVILIGAAVYLG